jgi:hypothetical protein
MNLQVLAEALNVLHEIRNILREMAPQFRGEGVQLELDYAEPQANLQSYEISIWLRTGTNVLDVIEFFVVRDGKMVASSDELLSWTREQLQEALTGRRTKQKGEESDAADDK